MAKRSRRPIIKMGPKAVIEAAVCQDGTSPAVDFLQLLDSSDLRKIQALFIMMTTQGKITNHEKFKKLEDKIYEFKSHQIRIPCFQDKTSWVLTHGFRKKGDNTPRAEIERAHRIREEDLNRK